MGVDVDQVQFVAGNALNLPGSLPRAVDFLLLMWISIETKNLGHG